MSLIVAARLKKLFDLFGIRYQVLSHSRTDTLIQAQQMLQLPEKSVAKSVLLKDDLGVLLAVIPLNCDLDLQALYKRYKRHFSVLSKAETDKYFFDCEPGNHPPMGEPYGLKMVIDNSFLKGAYVYLEPGSHTSLLRLTKEDYQFLNTNAIWANISRSLEEITSDERVIKSQKGDFDSFSTIGSIYALPSVSKIARLAFECVLEYKDIGSLITEIQQDPHLMQSLSHYLSSMSNSLLLEGIQSEQSLKRMEPELLITLTLGFVFERQFQVQKEGPLGLISFWRHAVLSAALCRDLCKATNTGLDPHMAYLCGLLHNLGLLLFGHFFKPEFSLLNKMVSIYPNVPVELLEKKIFGMGQAQKIVASGHAYLGAWLLESWGLPHEVVVSAREHHHLKYSGNHEKYVQILYIANTLLRAKGVGDGRRVPLHHLPLAELGLTQDLLKSCIDPTKPDTLPPLSAASES